jgi:hypothetical protein
MPSTVHQCEHEDAYDDMYPEFAPEPIVVRCEAPATWWHRFLCVQNPEPPHDSYWEEEWLCQEHASLRRGQEDPAYGIDHQWVDMGEG